MKKGKGIATHLLEVVKNEENKKNTKGFKIAELNM